MSLINGKPDIYEFHSTVEKLNSDFQLYKISAEQFRKVLKENKNNLRGWKEYDSSLQDVSKETVDKLSELVDAFKNLSNNLKPYVISLSASEDWANSGIVVKKGDKFYVESSGGWAVSANYNNAGIYGYSDTLNSTYSINPKFPLGAILYRIRGSDNQSGFGFDGTSRGLADSNGRLEFSINDNDLLRKDYAVGGFA